MKAVIFALILILCLQSIRCITIIQNNGTAKPVILDTPYFEAGPKLKPNTTLFGAIIPIGFSTKELQNCSAVNSTVLPFLRGNIALLVIFGGCSFEKHIMVAQKAGARAVILVAQFSWFFCRVKSRDHHKYNITIPAVCIEQDLAEKYLNASALKRIVYTRFSGNQNKLDKLNKGAIIFLQIFFLANLFAAVVLCAIRFIQFNFFSKSKFNASNIVHLFFLVGTCLMMVAWADPYTYWRKITIFPEYYEMVYISYLFVGVGFFLVCFQMFVLLKKITESKLLWIPMGMVLVLIAFVVVTNITFVCFAERNIPERMRINAMNAISSGFLTIGFFSSGVFLILKFYRFSLINSGNQKEKKQKYFYLGVTVILHGVSSFFSVVLWSLTNFHKSKPSVSLVILIFAASGEALACYTLFFIFRPKLAGDSSRSTEKTTGSSMKRIESEKQL